MASVPTRQWLGTDILKIELHLMILDRFLTLALDAYFMMISDDDNERRALVGSKRLSEVLVSSTSMAQLRLLILE